MDREDLLARTFVELADTLVDDFDVVEVTQMLVERCVEASSMRRRPDSCWRTRVATSACWPRPPTSSESWSSSRCRRRKVLASTATARACPSSDRDLAHTNGRWPSFAPVALEAGYRSVHALPVSLRQHVIGALNLFRSDTGAFSELDVVVAQAVADATAIAILQQRALHDARLLADQLRAALNSRILIEQAKGMLAERARLSIGDAFIQIRRYARNHNQQLTVVCQSVLDGVLKTDELARGAAPNRAGEEPNGATRRRAPRLANTRAEHPQALR